ncbi:hypothetical protein NUW54_g9615 [Trametes sanguinea]|uniref:Uncharacterized protein n=1 Tax=Trametes sanguinea TaxID=158606 RepID=A0ACC1P645_9APHY|nr:hypothetical protein NUW54_g9615 [Trametes sanguinea]
MMRPVKVYEHPEFKAEPEDITLLSTICFVLALVMVAAIFILGVTCLVFWDDCSTFIDVKETASHIPDIESTVLLDCRPSFSSYHGDEAHGTHSYPLLPLATRHNIRLQHGLPRDCPNLIHFPPPTPRFNAVDDAPQRDSHGVLQQKQSPPSLKTPRYGYSPCQHDEGGPDLPGRSPHSNGFSTASKSGSTSCVCGHVEPADGCVRTAAAVPIQTVSRTSHSEARANVA